MLASGRLSPELKKLSLLLRANAELILKFYEHSAKDINAALELMTEPDSAVLGPAAMVAFANKNDSVAREFLGEALEIAPHDKKLHELTLVLDYFSGSYQSVIDKSTEHLLFRDATYSYFGLLRYLAQKKLGKQEKLQMQAQLEAQLEDGFSNEETSKMLNYYLGKKEISQILPKLTESGVDLSSYSRIYFFVAEKMMVDGNIEKAKEYWQKVIDVGLAHRFEYIGASRRLAMFKK